MKINEWKLEYFSLQNTKSLSHYFKYLSIWMVIESIL